MLASTPRTFIGSTTFTVTAAHPVDRADIAAAVDWAGHALVP